MARIPLPRGLLTRPIAHRGLHDRRAGRIENSISAIQAAIDKAYAVEIDLQLSSDWQPVVFHDAGLERLTSARGRVRDLSARALSELTLVGGTDRISRLSEVLDLVAGRTSVLIELKDQTGNLSESDGRLESATARLLAHYTGEVAVMSFNPDSIRLMAELAPEIPRGLVTCAFDEGDWEQLSIARREYLRRITDHDATKSSFASHDATDLDRPRIAELKASGCFILCWTIRSPAEEEQARKIADNITFEGYLPPCPP